MALWDCLCEAFSFKPCVRENRYLIVVDECELCKEYHNN